MNQARILTSSHLKCCVFRRLVMSRLCVAIIVCLVLSLTGCAVFRTDAEAAKYETVRVSLRHDTAEAIKHNVAGLKALEGGHLDKAEKHFQKALIADVDFGPAHNNLGELYYSQEKLYLAAWEFEYAIKLMPERPEPHNNLGLVYEDASRFADALREYETALATETAGIEPFANLTRVRIRRGERSTETAHMLHDLVLKDDRPEWREWAREQLATTHRDLLDCEDEGGQIVSPERLDSPTPGTERIRIGPELVPPDIPVPETSLPALDGEPNVLGVEGRTTLRSARSRVQQVNWYDGL